MIVLEFAPCCVCLHFAFVLLICVHTLYPTKKNQHDGDTSRKDEYVCQEKVLNTKSVVSKVKWLSYLICLLVSQFGTVNGQFITTTSTTRYDNNNTNNDNDDACDLDNTFTFGLSLTYASLSIILSLGVSYWSFKSMTGVWKNSLQKKQSKLNCNFTGCHYRR